MFIFNCNTTYIKHYTRVSQIFFHTKNQNNYSYPKEPPPMKMTTKQRGTWENKDSIPVLSTTGKKFPQYF